MFSSHSPRARTLVFALAAVAATSLGIARAGAESLLLVEVDSGKVLHAENAAYPWYPASVTKIMTTYVVLRAIREGRITLDTLLTVSPNAVAQQPVKMGFPTGTTVTVDNALKMLLVKSANDMAVVLAEGVGGSIEGFADLMNANAQRLGMTQSHFVNPNGLPADDHVMSARDLAILARAVLREFPEYDYLWHLPGIRLGKRVVRNYNPLLGRYPGTDGMKTGFICASGFNLVATATRNNRRLIAVVLGAPSSTARAMKAAQLLERGFSQGPLSWLTPSLGTVDALQPVNVDPPNLREEMCGGHRRRAATEEDAADLTPLNSSPESPYGVFLSALRPPTGKAAALLQDVHLGEPVVVFTGPPKGQPKIAAVDAKVARTAPTPTVAAAAAIPWRGLTPSAASSSAALPAALPADAVEAGVPLPRARPRVVVQAAPQAQRTALAPKPPQTRPAAKPDEKK